MSSSNELDIPDALINLGHSRSQAQYCDVNPVINLGDPDLLYDLAAIFASVRNMILCYKGSRSRIFQEDYFCEVYERLQEPFDEVTAAGIRIDLFQSLKQWEPRVEWDPSKIQVFADYASSCYHIAVYIELNGRGLTGQFNLPVSG